MGLQDPVGSVGTSEDKNLQVVKNIITEDVPPPTPICVVGDVYRVEHVISNNVIKFSPQDGVIQVKVSNGGASPASRESICDPRPGILSEGDQAELFTGVFRVRSYQLQQGKGSGLGLALCKQIVTLYGGTVGVELKEGRGSIFYSAFYYPTLQYHR